MPATARICRMMMAATIPTAAHSIQAGKYEPNRSMVGAELHAATGSAIAIRPKTSEPRRRRPARSHLPLPTASRDLGRAVEALGWVAVRSSFDGGAVDGGASVIVVLAAAAESWRLPKGARIFRSRP